MPHTDRKPLTPPRLRLAGLCVVLAAGMSFAAFAQSTLPLPTPGASPPPQDLPGADAAKSRAAALAAKANIDVGDAWTRATNGNASTADVFLHIVSAKDPDRLMSVDSAMARDVELRQTPGAGQLPVDIPAGGTINLAPGGQHLTLVGLKAPLKEGDSFLLTFHFDKAGTQSASVKILAPNATSLPATNVARRGDTTAGVTQR